MSFLEVGPGTEAMPIVIDASNVTDKADLLQSCLAFRQINAERFSFPMDALSSSEASKVRQSDGHVPKHDVLEQDNFDGDQAAHFIVKENDHIAAYCRLLPTTGAHPGAFVFPQIFGIDNYPSGPGICELSPVILEHGAQEHNRQMDLCEAMVSELMHYCRARQIWGLIFTVETSWLSWMLGCGYEILPLGLPTQVRGKVMVPLRMRVD